jgi:hypothetical protein
MKHTISNKKSENATKKAKTMMKHHRSQTATFYRLWPVKAFWGGTT